MSTVCQVTRFARSHIELGENWHLIPEHNQDAYLYYFLLRYPGRSLVFLSSIDGIRRLMPMLELLEVKAFPLHSQLEQRQRLKNLDRLVELRRSSESGGH